MTEAELTARFLGQADPRLIEPSRLAGLARAFDEAASHLRAAAKALATTEDRAAGLPSAVAAVHDADDRYVEELTERELQVLALLASGRTNAAIASALVISRFTVGNHLRNIYGKLGVNSRSAATRAAFERGLVGTAPERPRADSHGPQPDGRLARFRVLVGDSPGGNPSQMIRPLRPVIGHAMPAAS